MIVGWVMMSERELNRIEVLSQVTQGRMTAVAASNVLGLSRRQVQRLLKVFQSGGAAAIRHRARGRRSNNWIDPAIRDFAITLVKEKYADFGPTLAAEKLAEDHDLKVSRETLRKCPLMHPTDALSGYRWSRMLSGFRASSGASFINHACAENALAS